MANVAVINVTWIGNGTWPGTGSQVCAYAQTLKTLKRHSESGKRWKKEGKQSA